MGGSRYQWGGGLHVEIEGPAGIWLLEFLQTGGELWGKGNLGCKCKEKVREIMEEQKEEEQ